MKDRLQLRHHSQIFESREAAIDYIYTNIRNASGDSLARYDSNQKYSLFAEPTVLRYKNEEDTSNPHVIIAVGSDTNNAKNILNNRFCIIDIDKTEADIENLQEEVAKLVGGITIVTKPSDTLNLYSEITEEGNVISGDVKVAESHVFNDIVRRNSIISTEDGIFTFVKVEYNEGEEKFTFIVNGEETEIPLADYYVTAGWYSKKDESLHLLRKDGKEVLINLESLVDEWSVEGEASNTPIVLTREQVGYGISSSTEHYHTEPFQDVLKADVRIDPEKNYNILKKSVDGRYLYVDGVANNIKFFKNGQVTTVQDALIDATKGISNDSMNIIYEKIDGYYATAQLKYINKQNKLVFTTSNVTGGTNVEEIQLNSISAFEDIYYIQATETLVIKWIDANGNIQTTEIALSGMISEWDVLNEGHNIELHKKRNIDGKDKLSADAKLFDDPDNILVDRGHYLFVKGTADNIKYGDTNVKEELDKINIIETNTNAKVSETSGKVDTLIADFNAEVTRSVNEDARLSGALENEIHRSTTKDAEHDSKITEINNTIGNGFSTDGHETVTYKFNELSGKTSVIAAKTENNTANIALVSAKTESEASRAMSEEQRIENKFDGELGDGFSVRNTVRDEIDREKTEREANVNDLQGQIDVIDDKIDARFREVINTDHSINVDKSEQSKANISVNLSDEQIENIPNVIKLNNDGLYAGVDLEYYFDSGSTKNVLVFKTTNGTKTFDLKSNSTIDKIYYDPTIEAIIIEYTVGGHRMPDVVVPVGDLIDEWRVSDDTNGAIRLRKYRESGATQDVLYAESIISNHDDNILINDNGALYVSNRDIVKNAEDITELVDSVNDMVDDIDDLNNALDAEISRSTTKDTELQSLINNEANRAAVEETRLYNAISAETQARQDADTRLEGLINGATLTFADTQSIDFTKTTGNVVTADIKLEQDANIVKLGNAGLYARVWLEYEPGTNKIRLATSDGNQEYIQLVGASLLENLVYDPIEKALVITYKDATGVEHTVQFGVEELFNDWIVQNPSEKSAIELSKLPPAVSGDPDTLSARVLITDDRDGDGKPDAGSENIIQIRNNGLYVDGSLISGAVEDIACLENELGEFEKSVIGHKIDETCGSGYTYTPYANGCFINTATSMYDADAILDKYVCSAHTRINNVESDVECLTNELNITQNNVLGINIPECGINIDGTQFTYQPHRNACFISAATSMDDADVILDTTLCGVKSDLDCVSGETKATENVLGVVGNCGNAIAYPQTAGCLLSSATSFANADAILEDAVCELINSKLEGSETPTTSTKLENDKDITVDVRLSHGSDYQHWQTDDDLTIKDYAGECVESGTSGCLQSEFTDTNVLRIVDLTDIGVVADSKYNGLYLSNVWDCGQYTENGVGTPGEKYRTDDSYNASNYYDRVYRNGRR